MVCWGAKMSNSTQKSYGVLNVPLSTQNNYVPGAEIVARPWRWGNRRRAIHSTQQRPLTSEQCRAEARHAEGKLTDRIQFLLDALVLCVEFGAPRDGTLTDVRERALGHGDNTGD